MSAKNPFFKAAALFSSLTLGGLFVYGYASGTLVSALASASGENASKDDGKLSNSGKGVILLGGSKSAFGGTTINSGKLDQPTAQPAQQSQAPGQTFSRTPGTYVPQVVVPPPGYSKPTKTIKMTRKPVTVPTTNGTNDSKWDTVGPNGQPVTNGKPRRPSKKYDSEQYQQGQQRGQSQSGPQQDPPERDRKMIMGGSKAGIFILPPPALPQQPQADN